MATLQVETNQHESRGTGVNIYVTSDLWLYLVNKRTKGSHTYKGAIRNFQF